MAKIKTNELQEHGTVAVAGYTGRNTLVPGTETSPARLKPLPKVVGDPATVELAKHTAKVMR